ncbi:DUF2254 domain-containing protein [Streptomyces sp. SID4944]|nr:DUF2254 domain-containing protein [Streptomyces sp. SID4944]
MLPKENQISEGDQGRTGGRRRHPAGRPVPRGWLRRSPSHPRGTRFSLLIPLLGFLAGGVWGLATTAVDQHLSSIPSIAHDQDFQSTRDASRAIIDSVGPPMLSFIGVVFSLTLVAVQMAAQNLTPRVVRLFVQSRVTKTALALFLGTFFYTLVVRYLSLRVEDNVGKDDAFVPLLSGLFTMALVTCSVLAFIGYVQHTLRLMRLTEIIDLLTRETLRTVRTVKRPERAPRDSDQAVRDRPDPHGHHAGLDGCPGGRMIRYTGPPGTLAGVRSKALVREAARNGYRVCLLPRVGDYLAPGSPLFRIFGADGVEEQRLSRMQRHLSTSSEREPAADVAFGLRQLVDIGLRALSSSVNDPTTAVQVLDRIQVVLIACARTQWGWIEHADRKKVVRLLESTPSWDDLVTLGCEEMLLCMGASPQVTRRFMAFFEDLEQVVPKYRRPVVTRYRERLQRHISRAFDDPGVQAFAGVPDRQGIG